jgi:DNA polymerase V
MIRRPEAAASSFRLDSSGFPSPAADYTECGISLDHSLIDHPEATFFFRASGHELERVGIYDGDLLIVDRSLTPQSAQLVVAVADGELVIRRAIDLNKEDQGELTLWGVIRWSIHQP